MKKIEHYFKQDSRYTTLLNAYNKLDGIIAVVYYVFLLIAYYVSGVIYAKSNIYLANQLSQVLVIFIILILIIRKQRIETIGFSKNNIKKSLILGVVSACVVFLINFIPNFLKGNELLPFSQLLSSFIFYLFVIALTEEIIFRGYIQTRIYGIIKKPSYAILLTAFMFMVMHIPFQMGIAQMDFTTFVANNYITLIFQFSWHIVFNFMYTKYNSIIAPTIFHTVMNWSNYLFIR